METTSNLNFSVIAQTPTVVEIPTEEIKFFVRRARSPGGYSRLKESIKEVGLHQPIQVRDIQQWTATERKRPDGGFYNYELICGQGRLQAFRELALPKIPAIVIDVPEREIVGRFLAENVIRKSLSWYESAQLVKKDFDNGLDIEEIKRKYFITSGHVYKYLRILRQVSSKLIENAEIEKLSMNDAEVLTSLSQEDQEVVVEVLKEEQLESNQISTLIKKAKEIKREGELSKDTLRNSLKNLNSELKELRQSVKLKRLHWLLGPQNLDSLLSNPKFRSALEGQKIEYHNYFALTNKQEVV